jgi:hypothetical protein
MELTGVNLSPARLVSLFTGAYSLNHRRRQENFLGRAAEVRVRPLMMWNAEVGLLVFIFLISLGVSISFDREHLLLFVSKPVRFVDLVIRYLERLLAMVTELIGFIDFVVVYLIGLLQLVTEIVRLVNLIAVDLIDLLALVSESVRLEDLVALDDVGLLALVAKSVSLEDFLVLSLGDARSEEQKASDGVFHDALSCWHWVCSFEYRSIPSTIVGNFMVASSRLT